MDRDRHEELQRRIERLERGYHKWRRTGVGAIAVAIVLLAYNAYTYAQQGRTGEVQQPKTEPAKNDPGQVQVSIDAERMRTTYANFFRVTGNPDEVILDFGVYS